MILCISFKIIRPIPFLLSILILLYLVLIVKRWKILIIYINWISIHLESQKMFWLIFCPIEGSKLAPSFCFGRNLVWYRKPVTGIRSLSETEVGKWCRTVWTQTPLWTILNNLAEASSFRMESHRLRDRFAQLVSSGKTFAAQDKYSLRIIVNHLFTAQFTKASTESFVWALLNSTWFCSFLNSIRAFLWYCFWWV